MMCDCPIEALEKEQQYWKDLLNNLTKDHQVSLEGLALLNKRINRAIETIEKYDKAIRNLKPPGKKDERC